MGYPDELIAAERWAQFGGPAFPFEAGGSGVQISYPGMTLRDYFAGQALAGMKVPEDGFSEFDAIRARRCYSMADAMLKAREE